MASITIRNFDDELKERLRVRAAKHGHSMEEEVRILLRRALGGVSGPALWALSRENFDADAGVELAAPDRADERKPPEF